MIELPPGHPLGRAHVSPARPAGDAGDPTRDPAAGRSAPDGEGRRRQPRDQPEHRAQGLPRARPRAGSWRAGAVRERSSPPTSLPSRPTRSRALRTSLQRWIERARSAGLDDEQHRSALRRHRSPARFVEGGMSELPAIDADRLGRRYGSRWALRDCTLEIPAGNVTALVGPNGAGKTTLLHLIVGLNRPSAGEVKRLRPCAASGGGARAPASRLRRAGPSALSRLHDRRDAEARTQAQRELGRGGGRRAHRAPRPFAASEGRETLGRPAGAGRAHTRTREATRAARCSTSRSLRSTRSRGASSSRR